MRLITVITTTVIIICSSIASAQNTFYTKGVKLEEIYDDQAMLFNKVSGNENYLAIIRVMGMFKKVNLYSYDFDVTFDVDSTSVENEGYTLYCIDSIGESAIVIVNLDKMVIVVWFYDKNGNVIKETFKINIIK
jgi:hypothetical protein